MSEKMLKIIFCLPGNIFTGRFLDCWIRLFDWCLHNGIQPSISRQESCNIYYVRNMCLGASIERGRNQKPFNGKIDYDFILWIDSDIIFAPEHLAKLINHNKDIVAGVYLMSDKKHFATVKEWDEEYFKKHGYFQFLAQSDVASFSCHKPETENCEPGNLLEVAYTGMGFMLVKYGVFEAMEYPWFKPLEKQIGEIVDITTEDVSFCLKVKELGFKVYVDPSVCVGHEKREVII